MAHYQKRVIYDGEDGVGIWATVDVEKDARQRQRLAEIEKIEKEAAKQAKRQRSYQPVELATPQVLRDLGNASEEQTRGYLINMM